MLQQPVPLPADDASLADLSLDELQLRWADAAARPPISAEAMTGADRKAQELGTPGERLMEHAGTAVAAAARALVAFNGREGRPVLILAGPGNNGGDGFVAARRLAEWGTPCVVVLVSGERRPGTKDAARNWDRLEGIDGVTRIHAPVARDVAVLGQGIGKAAIVVDALLGTGVRGLLREPVRAAVEVDPGRAPGGRARARRRHADGRRPHVGRPVGPRRPRRPHGHLPPAQDGPPDEDGPLARRTRPRRPDRHPAGGRPWLSPASPGSARSR